MNVYKITNMVNGKIYIGQEKRNKGHYFGSGLLIKKAILKYGKENFKKEILETCETKEELDEREIFWIAELNSTDQSIGYNIAQGGSGSHGYEYTEEHRKRISEANTGKKRTQEFKDNVARIAKERWQQPGYKEMICEKIRKAKEGKPRTAKQLHRDEDLKKISKTRIKNYKLTSPDGKEYSYDGVPLKRIAEELNLAYNYLNNYQRANNKEPIKLKRTKNGFISSNCNEQSFNTEGWVIESN